MNPRPAFRPARRGSRTMGLLASARPASLDPASVPLADIGQKVSLEQHKMPDVGVGGRRRALRLGAGGAVAAGAAAVAVLIAVSAGAPRPGAAPRVPGLSARAILLTAAVNAAAAPSAGRYWQVETASGMLMAAGPNAHPFAVIRQWSPTVSWDAVSPSERSWNLPAAGYTSRPATPGAAAAWRADGSPALPSSSSPQQAWWQVGGSVGYFGDSSPPLASYQALPSDPAALAAAVRSAAMAQEQTPSPPANAAKIALPSLSQDMFGIYTQLLKWDPITPQVRAAVFRDIAALPGVRSAGRLTDPLGRQGYGIALAASAAGGEEEVLVISPASGSLLADERLSTPPSGKTTAASGAVPGPTTCPAPVIRKPGGTVCIAGAQVSNVGGVVSVQAPSGGTLREYALGPELALPAGQIVSYDAVVSAGWTDVTPQLPPPSQQFSVATDGKG